MFLFGRSAIFYKVNRFYKQSQTNAGKRLHFLQNDTDELSHPRSHILDTLKLGEYDSHECLTEHVRSNHFQVLVGAAAVLGQSFKMSLAEVTETGGIEFVRAQYSSLG